MQSCLTSAPQAKTQSPAKVPVSRIPVLPEDAKLMRGDRVPLMWNPLPRNSPAGIDKTAGHAGR